jgi:hypothetical protein
MVAQNAENIRGIAKIAAISTGGIQIVVAERIGTGEKHRTERCRPTWRISDGDYEERDER